MSLGSSEKEFKSEPKQNESGFIQGETHSIGRRRTRGPLGVGLSAGWVTLYANEWEECSSYLGEGAGTFRNWATRSLVGLSWSAPELSRCLSWQGSGF